MTQMKKMQGMFSWVVILSECSHVFCCVLPSMFSILTLLVGVGMVGAMPIWMQSVHEALHEYEVPMMIMSGAVVLIGWVLNYISTKIDCHDTGCGHGVCTPKKKRSERILMIATLLFLANITIYILVHKDVTGVFQTITHAHEQRH